MTKRCSLCGLEKPLADFQKMKSGKHGVHSRCRECCVNRWFDPFAAAPCDDCSFSRRCSDLRLQCKVFQLYCERGSWHKNMERLPSIPV